MTHKRFDNPNGTLKDSLGHNGVTSMYDIDTLADELYNRVGAKFTVRWEPWATAEPIIETDTLPANVSEADVENALNGMKTDGFL